MSETNLFKWLKPWFPQGRVTRVENPDAGPGTPDVNYRIAKAEGWIELKHARSRKPLVPFPDVDKGLHKSQLDWIRDQVTFGGIVWVVARVGDEVFWVPGIKAPAFNGANMTRLRRISVHVIDMKHPHLSLRKIKAMMEGEMR